VALLRSHGGINAPPAWDKSTGTGVVVAVIDTGYRPHADLAGAFLQGYDFISDTFVSERRQPAATPTPAILATGSTRASAGPATRRRSRRAAGTARTCPARSPRVPTTRSAWQGVAFNARIVPARVLGKCGGYTSDIADAIVWTSGGTVSGVPANANPAKVLSISLGGGGACDSTTQNAINSARSRGASVIVGGRQRKCQRRELYAGELLGRRDRGGGGPQWRQSVVLELRRDGGSGGARRQRRRQQRACRR
jgi:serine protease